MSKRNYDSTARTEQAEKTRQAILRAAQTLFARQGYDATTIQQIAAAAKVAAPTVYAAFKSKRGIIVALMDQARFGAAYRALVEEAMKAEGTYERLAFAGRIARQIYESESKLFAQGLGAISPELAELEREKESVRFERQSAQIDALQKAKRLRKGLPPAEARDVLWVLTSRSLYRALVHERGWSAERYEKWLNALLARELVSESK